MKSKRRRSVTINTDVSTAYWYVSGSKQDQSFVKAKIPSLTKENSLSWLDMMLDGGIYLPEIEEDQNRALICKRFSNKAR